MPTNRYLFHATNGHEFVLDRTGKRLPTLALVMAHADGVARDLAQNGEGRFDWSGWVVEVYGDDGRCVIVHPFERAMQTRKRTGYLQKFA